MIYNDPYPRIDLLLTQPGNPTDNKISTLLVEIENYGKAIQENFTQHQGHCQEFFKNLSLKREQLISANLLVPEIGNAVSNLIAIGLGLKGQKNTALVKSTITSNLKQNSLEALAHWINTEKIPLRDAGLLKSDLEAIAPYLHYVNCEGLWLDDPQKFVDLCSNAYHLTIHYSKMRELKNLSPHLLTLDCSHSQHLISIDLSKTPHLQSLYISGSPITTPDFSHTPKLQTLVCIGCPISEIDLSLTPLLHTLACSDTPIKTLNLSLTPDLKLLQCDRCQNLTTLDLTHNRHLQTLSSDNSPLITLDLSNNPQLERLHCNHSQNLTAVNLSNNPLIQKVKCNNCPNLSSLGSAISNTLKKLDCRDCPKLEQLPPLPQLAAVYSIGSPWGGLHTFNVSPADLEKKPKEVLLNLGKFLLQNEPLPNIVFIDPATNEPSEDIGVLESRQPFVETLCEYLFKEGSAFAFVKDNGYDIPISDDVDALRTFARLLGLGIPTATNLHPAFFHSLFALNEQELASIPFKLPEPLKQNILNATAIVAKELQTLLGAKFRPENIDDFIVKVQGPQVTKALLKQRTYCENEQYKEWIDSFIDTLQEPKQFVQLLTGSYCLNDGTIIFNVDSSKKHLEFSSVILTCESSMDLPGDLTKDLLHEELNAHLKLLTNSSFY
jgi:hypothetical protein